LDICCVFAINNSFIHDFNAHLDICCVFAINNYFKHDF
jgi:hypothetical protein